VRPTQPTLRAERASVTGWCWVIRSSRDDVARQELSIPPKITLEQAKGFSLFALRTILSGGADEILELAKTNLRQLSRE
jgi:hypothetical protein